MTYRLNKGGTWSKDVMCYDHLGNVLLSLRANVLTNSFDITSESYYRAFGQKIDVTSPVTHDRLGFINKEKDVENDLGDFGVRKYDDGIGRFTSTDKLFEKYPGWTPYQYSLNNPVNLLDPNGREYYINKYGYLYNWKQQNPDDPTVYIATNEDGEWTYENIGQIGGEIDITKILSNFISNNQDEAKNITIFGFGLNVMTGHKWDLKNRTDMIFGLAWSKQEQSKLVTKFNFGNFTDMKACDVGNFFAGVMGNLTGIGDYTLLQGAGLAEIQKRLINGQDITKRLNELYFNEWPFGDEKIDAIWNQEGMDYGRYIKAHQR